MEPEAQILKVLQSTTKRGRKSIPAKMIRFPLGVAGLICPDRFCLRLEEEFGITIPDSDLSARNI